MTRPVLVLGAALTTGLFCAIFALGVDLLTDALDIWQVAVAGGVSGVLGSVFAALVWRRKS